jgi:hypothetical protein
VLETGDYVYLKASLIIRELRLGIKYEVYTKVVDPYHIIARKGPVPYQLQLPREIKSAFNVFYVSQLKKCLRVPEERVTIKDFELDADLKYEEEPIQILDTKERVAQSAS